MVTRSGGVPVHTGNLGRSPRGRSGDKQMNQPSLLLPTQPASAAYKSFAKATPLRSLSYASPLPYSYAHMPSKLLPLLETGKNDNTERLRMPNTRTYLKIVDGKEIHLYKSGHAPFAR